MVTELLAGVIRTGPMLSLAAVGAANAGLLYQVSNYANQVGVKTFKLKRLKVRNNGAGDTWLHIGVGIPCVESMPALRIVNNFNGDFAEGDLPELEFAADMTAYVDAQPVDVQAEIEELG